MDVSKNLYQRITMRHGTVLDLKKNPGILEEILQEMRSLEHDDFAAYQKKTASPFNVEWMDSWAANWLLHQQSSSGQAGHQFNAVLRQMVDLKLRDRLHELSRYLGRYAEPPDGGPPEPGVPPAGPQAFSPPDEFVNPVPPFARVRGGGIFGEGPEPDPEPPDGGPPEPGVPNPPDPGPDPTMLRENPWILYWFVSINAPLILDMIDAHITRRLNDLKMQTHGS